MGICVNEKDVKFVLTEMIELQELLKLDIFKEFDQDMIDMVLSEGQKFSEEMLYEANLEGDKKPPELKDGQVTVLPAYKAAYDQIREGGWLGLSVSAEHGGQGLPGVVGLAANEFTAASSAAFAMYPGLTRAGGELLIHAGEDWMKEHVLPKLVSAEWTATMCLTEAGAGSAVGDLKATAKKVGDGEYLITGTKIFISSGDHDLTDQIIHLVLARVQGAPAGMKGVSLFLVPKLAMDKEGNLTGGGNDVEVGNLEHKMGITGSVTATLNFGDNGACKGWLVGKENEGIKAMFVMMNEARIGTGLLGHACASAAYQHALRYAKERVQGVKIEDMRDVNAPRVEIIKHPDVRRMLLNMKSLTEAMRSILYYSSFCEDMAAHHPDPAVKEKYENNLDLLTPICKAYCSDRGFEVTRDAIQTYGGYGYCSEYPVEQYMRDAKIMSIYEGTNGIQSLDLLGRKVMNMKKQMAPYNNFMAQMREDAERFGNNAALSDLADRLRQKIDVLDSITQHYITVGMSGDMLSPIKTSYPYMMAFGDVVAGYMLLWGAHVAQGKLDAGVDGETARAFYTGRVASAKFFIHNLLPNVDALAASCKSEDKTVLELEEECFV